MLTPVVTSPEFLDLRTAIEAVGQAFFLQHCAQRFYHSASLPALRSSTPSPPAAATGASWP